MLDSVELPVCSRTDAELGTERVVEIRHIPETGVQSNIKDCVVVYSNPRCCVPQSQTKHVLVGSNARDLLKHAQEMIAAEFGSIG